MLNRLSYWDFVKWYYEQYENDYEYIKEFENYGFRLVFYAESLKKVNIYESDKLNNLKPKYPWSEKILNYFDVEEKMKYQNEIESLKKKIEELEKKK